MLKYFQGGNGLPAEVVRAGFNLSVCYTLGYVAEIPSQHTSDLRKLGYDAIPL